jgi:hypothetical protein
LYENYDFCENNIVISENQIVNRKRVMRAAKPTFNRVKSSEFRSRTGKARPTDLSLRRLIMFVMLLQLNCLINSKILLNISLSTVRTFQLVEKFFL